MNTRIAPRLLIPALALVLMVTGVGFRAASAAQLDELSWSESDSPENILVQACAGFDLTTSYTVTRDHHRFTDVAHDLNIEWIGVDFAGSIGNAATGKSYAYNGSFNRWADYDKNTVAVTNLDLRFEVGTPGEFAITSDRLELDLDADPVAVIKNFVPYTLRTELCSLLADSSVEAIPQAPPEPDEIMASIPPNYRPSNDAENCTYISIPGIPLPC